MEELNKKNLLLKDVEFKNKKLLSSLSLTHDCFMTLNDDFNLINLINEKLTNSFEKWINQQKEILYHAKNTKSNFLNLKEFSIPENIKLNIEKFSKNFPKFIKMKNTIEDKTLNDLLDILIQNKRKNSEEKVIKKDNNLTEMSEFQINIQGNIFKEKKIDNSNIIEINSSNKKYFSLGTIIEQPSREEKDKNENITRVNNSNQNLNINQTINESQNQFNENKEKENTISVNKLTITKIECNDINLNNEINNYKNNEKDDSNNLTILRNITMSSALTSNNTKISNNQLIMGSTHKEPLKTSFQKIKSPKNYIQIIPNTINNNQNISKNNNLNNIKQNNNENENNNNINNIINNENSKTNPQFKNLLNNNNNNDFTISKIPNITTPKFQIPVKKLEPVNNISEFIDLTKTTSPIENKSNNNFHTNQNFKNKVFINLLSSGNEKVIKIPKTEYNNYNEKDYSITEKSGSDTEYNDEIDSFKFIPRWAEDKKYIEEQIKKQNENPYFYLEVFGKCVIEKLNLNMIFEVFDNRYNIRNNSTADWRNDNTNKSSIYGVINYQNLNENNNIFPETNRQLQFSYKK